MTISKSLAAILLGCSASLAALTAEQTPLDAARALFNDGRYAEAEKILSTEIEKTPQQAILYYWLGRCAFELRDSDQSVNSAERAVELDPEVAEYHHFLAQACGHKAEHSNWFTGLSLARKTGHELLEAVQIDPNNVRFERDLIAFYVRAPGIAGGGDDKAEAQIEKLTSIDPVQGYLARMDLYFEKKKWTEAEQECKAVLTAKPKEAGPYLEVAQFYEGREDVSGIRNALAAIPHSAPADSRVNFYRGVADTLAGDRLEEAEASLKAYLANLPQRREEHASRAATRMWLGRLYEKQGRSKEAAIEYRAALELDPTEKGARDGLKRTGS